MGLVEGDISIVYEECLALGMSSSSSLNTIQRPFTLCLHVMPRDKSVNRDTFAYTDHKNKSIRSYVIKSAFLSEDAWTDPRDIAKKRNGLGGEDTTERGARVAIAY